MRIAILRGAIVFVALAGFTTVADAQAVRTSSGGNSDLTPTGKGWGVPNGLEPDDGGRVAARGRGMEAGGKVRVGIGHEASGEADGKRVKPVSSLRAGDAR